MTPIFWKLPPEINSQATAVWTWCNFLHEQVPPGMTPLRINFDETAVRYQVESRSGCLTQSAQRERRTPRSLTRQATRATTRSMLSLCTFVCDDAEIQKRLPQVLVVNGRRTSAAEADAMLRELPECMHLWRQPRCWTTAETMQRLLRLLADALRPYRESHKVIFSFDAFRAHLAQKVWRTAAREGFLTFLIPARLTWALQPCDTHVFSGLKRRLESVAQEQATKTTEGDLSPKLLARAIAVAVREVVQGRSWLAAFRDCGLNGTQAGVSARTLAKLGNAAEPAAAHLPTLQMLQDVFPARAHVPIDAVFAPFLPTRNMGGDRGRRRRAAGPLTSEGSPERPWPARLRSSSALGVRDEAAVASPPAGCHTHPMPPRPPAPAPLEPPASLEPPRARRRIPVGRLLLPARPPPPPPPAA